MAREWQRATNEINDLVQDAVERGEFADLGNEVAQAVGKSIMRRLRPKAPEQTSDSEEKKAPETTSERTSDQGVTLTVTGKTKVKFAGRFLKEEGKTGEHQSPNSPNAL